MHKILILSLLVVLFAVPASGVTEHEKFQFYNQCSPVSLYWVELNEDAKKLGITEKTVRNLVESRLRSARIYDEKSESSLLAEINVFENYFTVYLGYFPVVRSLGGYGVAETWRKTASGTHKGNKNSILSPFPEYIDEFINEYLKVNQKDCK